MLLDTMFNPNDKQQDRTGKDPSHVCHDEKAAVEHDRLVEDLLDSDKEESKTQSTPTTEELKITLPFPINLYDLIIDAEEKGDNGIVSFCRNGKAFVIHKPKQFTKELIPRYFKSKRFDSFQRQLLLYGFKRFVAEANNMPGYYHEFFLKGQRSASLSIKRKRQKVRCKWNLPSSTSLESCPLSDLGGTSLSPPGPNICPASLEYRGLVMINRAIRRNASLISQMTSSSSVSLSRTAPSADAPPESLPYGTNVSRNSSPAVDSSTVKSDVTVSPPTLPRRQNQPFSRIQELDISIPHTKKYQHTPGNHRSSQIARPSMFPPGSMSTLRATSLQTTSTLSSADSMSGHSPTLPLQRSDAFGINRYAANSSAMSQQILYQRRHQQLQHAIASRLLTAAVTRMPGPYHLQASGGDVGRHCISAEPEPAVTVESLLLKQEQQLAAIASLRSEMNKVEYLLSKGARL